jgi:hypothetical protein
MTEAVLALAAKKSDFIDAVFTHRFDVFRKIAGSNGLSLLLQQIDLTLEACQ